jgi:hypothetical protein
VHAAIENKNDDTKNRFYEELECVFHQFPKNHMKMLLGDLIPKVGRGNIFKPTSGNNILY